MPKLTQRYVDSLEPKATRWVAWDDSLKGFGVRIQPSGRKSFVATYRPLATGKFTWLTLGSQTILSAVEARKRAGSALAQVAAGQDPAEPRRVAATSEPEPRTHRLTLAQFAPIYLRDHAQKEKKPRSVEADRYNLDRFVLPALGNRTLEELSTVDIASLHAQIGTRTPVQANRVLALISVMFSKALEWKILPKEHENPAAQVSPYSETSRQRFLSHDELARVGDTLRELEQEADHPPGWANPNFARDRRDSVAIIRLIFFTGCRKMEIVALKKSYIDREWMKLRLPDSKGGPKEVSLTSHALGVLEAVMKRGDNAQSDWVFPGRDPSEHRSEPRRIWELVRERAALPDVTIHDIRRTYASLAANANTPPKVLQDLLGHARSSTTEKYVQLFDRSRDKSAERIAGLAAAALAGTPEAEVIPMRPGVD